MVPAIGDVKSKLNMACHDMVHLALWSVLDQDNINCFVCICLFAGSPFEVTAAGSCDVRASGDGLYNGIQGKTLNFNVDVSNNPGKKLVVTVIGTSSISFYHAFGQISDFILYDSHCI